MDLPAAADIDIEPSGEWTIGAIRINDSPLWMPSPLYEAATDYVLSQHGRDIDRAVRRSLGSAAIETGMGWS